MKYKALESWSRVCFWASSDCNLFRTMERRTSNQFPRNRPERRRVITMNLNEDSAIKRHVPRQRRNPGQEQITDVEIIFVRPQFTAGVDQRDKKIFVFICRALLNGWMREMRSYICCRVCRLKKILSMSLLEKSYVDLKQLASNLQCFYFVIHRAAYYLH